MPELNYFSDYRQRSHDQVVKDLNAAFKKIRGLYFLVGVAIAVAFIAVAGVLEILYL